MENNCIMMDPDERCALFMPTEDEVKAVRNIFGLTENSIGEGVDSIMHWFQKQPHLVHIGISRRIVEMMIMLAKGSIERAKEKIDNFYKYRFLLPDLIQNRQEILSSSGEIWGIYSVFALPKLQDNRRIFMVKFGGDLSKFNLVDFFRRVCLIMDLRMIYDYMAGDIWIVDLENIGWAQILTQNPLLLKKLADLFKNSLNWRIYGIHVLNIVFSVPIIQRLLDFYKQFITSVIMDRVMIHDSLQDLYKHVPKDWLPEDYGGKALSMRALAEITENEFRKPKIIEYLLECSKMISDESLRPQDENSEEFIPGSFRKLEVD